MNLFRPLALSRIQVRHPDRIDELGDRLTSVLALYAAGRLPECIAGAMIVVPCRSLLRAVYGTDARAVGALFLVLVRDALFRLVPEWAWRLMGLGTEECEL